MAKMFVVGASPTKIIRNLMASGKYDVSERTLWKDWATRHEWMPEIIQLDPKSLRTNLLEVLLSSMESRRYALQAFNMAREQSNINGMIGAIRTVNEVNAQIVELLKLTGAVEEPVKRGEVDVKVTFKEIARYIPDLVNVVMEEELGATDADLPDEGAEQSMD